MVYLYIIHTVSVCCTAVQQFTGHLKLTFMCFDRVLTERNVYGLTTTETDLNKRMRTHTQTSMALNYLKNKIIAYAFFGHMNYVFIIPNYTRDTYHVPTYI
jgi:hypothetical protein